MITQKEKQLDCLGFDRMQLAAIKRNYQNNKPLYVKMNKLAAKINKAIDEHHQLQADAAASDLYTRNLAKRVTGYDLTSDMVLEFHANPAKWEEFKAKNPISTEEVPEGAESEQPAETETPDGSQEETETPAEDTEEAPSNEQPAEAPAEEVEQPAQESEAPSAFGD